MSTNNVRVYTWNCNVCNRTPAPYCYSYPLLPTGRKVYLCRACRERFEAKASGDVRLESELLNKVCRDG